MLCGRFPGKTLPLFWRLAAVQVKVVEGFVRVILVKTFPYFCDWLRYGRIFILSLKMLCGGFSGKTLPLFWRLAAVQVKVVEGFVRVILVKTFPYFCDWLRYGRIFILSLKMLCGGFSGKTLHLFWRLAAVQVKVVEGVVRVILVKNFCHFCDWLRYGRNFMLALK